MLQHPTVPLIGLVGGKGDTWDAAPFPKSPAEITASKALPALGIVEIGWYSDCQPHRRGYFHSISSQPYPARGRWRRHSLPSGASSGHRESVKDRRGPRINLLPCSLNPLPAKLSSHLLFCHLRLVFQGVMNSFSITPR